MKITEVESKCKDLYKIEEIFFFVHIALLLLQNCPLSFINCLILPPTVSSLKCSLHC